MRNLVEVIDQMQSKIPQEESTSNLKGQLSKDRQSAKYAAPEMQPYWWNRVQNTLSAFLFNDKCWNPDENPWQENVRRIWTAVD